MLEDISPDRQLDVAMPDGVRASDYHLIEDAVMDTARGRWFMREYARRIRAAETTQLLEALARIEKSVADSRTQGVAPAVSEVAGQVDALDAAGDSDKALPAIMVGDAGTELQTIQEKLLDIVWYMRERGFDSSVCAAITAEAGKLRSIAAGVQSVTDAAVMADPPRPVATPAKSNKEISGSPDEKLAHRTAGVAQSVKKPVPRSRAAKAPGVDLENIDTDRQGVPGLATAAKGPECVPVVTPFAMPQREQIFSSLDGLPEQDRLRLFA